MFRLGHDLIAAVVVLVLRAEPMIQNDVVVALIENQYAIVFECSVKLRKRAAEKWKDMETWPWPAAKQAVAGRFERLRKRAGW